VTDEKNAAPDSQCNQPKLDVYLDLEGQYLEITALSKISKGQVLMYEIRDIWNVGS
jgi:hypothetical protein